MSIRSIKTISIAGAGTMGRGIAQAIAQAGFETILFDINHDVLENAETQIKNNLDQASAKQKVSPDEAKTIFERIKVYKIH
jgi:3-hydroxybutyryl-CoA dehydrogenase